jgi:hypothetical protein
MIVRCHTANDAPLTSVPNRRCSRSLPGLATDLAARGYPRNRTRCLFIPRSSSLRIIHDILTEQAVQLRSDMTHEPTDWRSFWDITTPQQGADVIVEMYGPAAVDAVLSCAAAAQSDNRDDDYQFWAAVLDCVQGGNH